MMRNLENIKKENAPAEVAQIFTRFEENAGMVPNIYAGMAHSPAALKANQALAQNLKEGVFFAKIICDDGVSTSEIDARPSDAIAIGLRFNAPFYTYETILSEAGIVLTA